MFFKDKQEGKMEAKNESKSMDTVKKSLILLSEYIQNDIKFKKKMLDELRSIKQKLNKTQNIIKKNSTKHD